VADNGVIGYWCENRNNVMAKSRVIITRATRWQSWRGWESIMVPPCGAAPKAAEQ